MYNYLLDLTFNINETSHEDGLYIVTTPEPIDIETLTEYLLDADSKMASYTNDEDVSCPVPFGYNHKDYGRHISTLIWGCKGFSDCIITDILDGECCIDHICGKFSVTI